MRKDVKIGMVIGFLLMAAAVVWVSTHPGFTNLGLQSNSETQLKEEKPTDAEITDFRPAIDKTSKSANAIPYRNTSTPNKTVMEPAESTIPQNKDSEKVVYTRIHTVEQGETLSGISQKYYGTARGWQKIYVANRNILGGPDRLRPGMRLAIPD